eukprot:GHVQ01005334.1.p1 GENE.GHVQ01005334.1~~GHVQ01005334.1.p1  ORF type:complete len:677 (-),score=52.12 GHVQ01005334.1:1032-3062(-)
MATEPPYSADRSVSRKEKLLAQYSRISQDHVFAFFDGLSKPEQESLLDSLESINPESSCDIYRSAVSAARTYAPDCLGPPDILQWSDSMQFPHKTACCITRLNSVDFGIRQAWRRRGLQLILDGKIAAVVMAGGQGTRLGYNGPKGCMSVGPLSEKSFFQIFCERIVRLKELARTQAETVNGSSGSATEGRLAPRHSGLHAMLGTSNPTIEGNCESDSCSARHVERMKDISLPLYIMTGEQNHSATQKFFQDNRFFGLPLSDVQFFQQPMIPCFDTDGKFLLETKCTIAKNPNGNGGIFQALQESGMLEDMINRGVEGLHVFGVDNILCKVADPTFVGYCISCNADVGNKCVSKIDAEEKVGVFCSKMSKQPVVIGTLRTNQNLSGSSSSCPASTPNYASGTSSSNSCSAVSEQQQSVLHRVPCVIEYSELPKNLRYERLDAERSDSHNSTTIKNGRGSCTYPSTSSCEAHRQVPESDVNGSFVAASNGTLKAICSVQPLTYSAGNIANHYFSVAFITRLLAGGCLNQMYHIAHKAIKHTDTITGQTVEPASSNGVKLELFVFDCFELAECAVGLEVDRATEFAPVKNKNPMSDSLGTAMAQMSGLHKMWIGSSGGAVLDDGNTSWSETTDITFVEVSPLVSYEGENLNGRFISTDGSRQRISLPYRLDFVSDEIG